MSRTYVTKIAAAHGIKIIDAREPLVLVVGANDIIKARQKNSKCCAIARAAQRIAGVRAAYVFRSMAFVHYADRIERHTLPPGVQKEIVSFDRAGIMAPGEYQLTTVSPSHSRANRAVLSARYKQRVARGLVKPVPRAGGQTAEPIAVRPAGPSGRRVPFIRGLREPK